MLGELGEGNKNTEVGTMLDDKVEKTTDDLENTTNLIKKRKMVNPLVKSKPIKKKPVSKLSAKAEESEVKPSDESTEGPKRVLRKKVLKDEVEKGKDDFVNNKNGIKKRKKLISLAKSKTIKKKPVKKLAKNEEKVEVQENEVKSPLKDTEGRKIVLKKKILNEDFNTNVVKKLKKDQNKLKTLKKKPVKLAVKNKEEVKVQESGVKSPQKTTEGPKRMLKKKIANEKVEKAKNDLENNTNVAKKRKKYQNEPKTIKKKPVIKLSAKNEEEVRVQESEIKSPTSSGGRKTVLRKKTVSDKVKKGKNDMENNKNEPITLKKKPVKLSAKNKEVKVQESEVKSPSNSEGNKTVLRKKILKKKLERGENESTSLYNVVDTENKDKPAKYLENIDIPSKRKTTLKRNLRKSGGEVESVTSKPITMDIDEVDEEIIVKTPPNVIKRVRKGRQQVICDSEAPTVQKSSSKKFLLNKKASSDIKLGFSIEEGGEAAQEETKKNLKRKKSDLFKAKNSNSVNLKNKLNVEKTKGKREISSKLKSKGLKRSIKQTSFKVPKSKKLPSRKVVVH